MTSRDQKRNKKSEVQITFRVPRETHERWSDILHENRLTYQKELWDLFSARMERLARKKVIA